MLSPLSSRNCHSMVCFWHRVLLKILLIYHLEMFEVYCLRDMKIHGPVAVQSGYTIHLSCDYDLLRAPLYSIKWYHDEQEFYRFVPKEDPPGQTFIVDPPINVDIKKSNEHDVYILQAHRALSGTYKCEVTADAPLFYTDIKSVYLNVVEVIPDSGIPEITTEHNTGFADDHIIHLTCRTPLLNVAPNITWYFQNQKIPNSTKIRKTYTIEGNPLSKDMFTARSDLFMNLKTNIDKELFVRCEVSLYNIYNKSSVFKIPIAKSTSMDKMDSTAPLGFSDYQSQTTNCSGGFSSNNFYFKIYLIFLNMFIYSR